MSCRSLNEPVAGQPRRKSRTTCKSFGAGLPCAPPSPPLRPLPDLVHFVGAAFHHLVGLDAVHGNRQTLLLLVLPHARVDVVDERFHRVDLPRGEKEEQKPLLLSSWSRNRRFPPRKESEQQETWPSFSKVDCDGRWKLYSPSVIDRRVGLIFICCD